MNNAYASRQRGCDPDGVRLEPPRDNGVARRGRSVHFASSSFPSAAAADTSSLNMTQEVQDLLQQVHDMRLKHHHNTSPRSILDMNEADHEQPPQQQQQHLQKCRIEDSDDRLISSFQLSVIDEEEGQTVESSRVKSNLDLAADGSIDTKGDDEESDGDADTNRPHQHHQQQHQLLNSAIFREQALHKLHLQETPLGDDSNENAEELLQAARQERAAARLWAQQLRRAVYQWVQQQKALVQHYQQQRRDSDDEDLWNKLAQLEERLRVQQAEHQTSEAALRAIIREQQMKLEVLQRETEQYARDKKQAGASQLKHDRQQQRSTIPSNVQGGAKPINNINNKASAKSCSTQSSSSSTGQQTGRSCISTDNCTIVTYGNGAVKEVHDDITIIRFPNGDVQTETVLERSYYFDQTGVIQICHLHSKNDVMEYHYPNGQIEEHWRDGRKTVLFPDGTMQHFSADGAPIVVANGVNVSAAAVTI